MTRFAEHRVVLPLVVIMELEHKRHDPELGFFARTALRLLDDLRITHGSLSEPVPIGDEGGALRVELNHISVEVLPHGFRNADNDTRILAVAKSLSDEGEDVTVVSKDLPMRVKASALGLAADEYRNEFVKDTGWTGIRRIDVADEAIDQLYQGQELPWNELVPNTGAGTDADADPNEPAPVNTGLVLSSAGSSALGRVVGEDKVQLVRGDQDAFGVHGRSAEQRLAMELLLDPTVGIVSLGGRAGTGKSALALAAGLEAVLERQEHRKIIVFRPLYAVGGQDLGYLPGTESEKMGPWGQAVYDTLTALVSTAVMEEIVDRDLLEVLPLTHIRGRSLHDAWVVVDEAQSLEKNVLLTVLSRIGQNSKVVLTHDVAQRDNLRVGRHDGVAAVVEKLKGHPLFGHITLTRSERSPIAALVTDLLEDRTH
ncbi:PhoH family protein [Citricoccus sp. NR2]|nr:PhoH family protein [Citricoccus sp. NR2]WBL20719.1 PhoH family protein [Citricoccus sp. NR2]